jgi:hypothetical protein
VTAFPGFPRELFAFFEGLQDDNSKAYWTANKATWEQHVRRPMLALLAELSDEFPPMRMFRPNRDVRFAKNKSPYKLWAGATSESHAVGGTGYYVSVSASGMVTGCGAMALARDQLQRFRAALDDDHSGRAFEELRTKLDAIAPRDLRRAAAAEDRPARLPVRPPARRAPALEGRGGDPGVRASRLDAHPRRARQDPRGVARSTTAQGVDRRPRRRDRRTSPVSAAGSSDLGIHRHDLRRRSWHRQEAHQACPSTPLATRARCAGRRPTASSHPAGAVRSRRWPTAHEARRGQRHVPEPKRRELVAGFERRLFQASRSA